MPVAIALLVACILLLAYIVFGKYKKSKVDILEDDDSEYINANPNAQYLEEQEIDIFDLDRDADDISSESDFSQENDQQFEYFQENAYKQLPDAIIILNAKEQIVYLNLAAEDMLECRLRSVMGRQYENVFKKISRLEYTYCTVLLPCTQLLHSRTV